MSEGIAPFRVEFSDDALADLHDRLTRTRWPERETVPDWSQGVPLAYLQEMCRYWATDYDWRAREARINEFPHFKTEIDGLDIHFMHVRSPEPTAVPLVLTHGWPGSVVEFLDVIGPLTDPVAHGGDAADALHLVVPSLPGYGFSDRPATTGWNRERIADAWAVLMARLGYASYFAQGGDWGASITNHLAVRDTEHVAGIHLNMVSAAPPPGEADVPEDPRTVAAREQLSNYMTWETGYQVQQRTRPQTLGYGLTDSPAGQCAWILEKFKSWTDCDGDPVAAFGADRLLDNITVYWLTATATSSARLYWEGQPAPFRGIVEVPMGASIFPKEIARPSREGAKRVYTDLRYWNELDRGGHFAAFEQPEIFVQELRNSFRLMR